MDADAGYRGPGQAGLVGLEPRLVGLRRRKVAAGLEPVALRIEDADEAARLRSAPKLPRSAGKGGDP